MVRKSFILILVFLITLSVVILAQKSDHVVLTHSGRQVSYQGYVKSGIQYISIEDFAKNCNIGCSSNKKVHKTELKNASYILKFSGNNPFISVFNRIDSTISNFQLPVSTFLINDKIYVPFTYTAAYLRKYLQQGIDTSIQAGHTPVVPVKTLTEKKKALNENNAQLKVEEKVNGTLVRLNFPGKIGQPTTEYSSGKIIVTIKPGTQNWNLSSELKNESIVRDISYKFQNGQGIFTIAISDNYAAHECIKTGDKNLLLTIHKKQFGDFSRANETKKGKWKFDVVVIDAGHGGKDYGAIGIHNTVEKDVNLGIALKLGAIIESEMKDVKVVYTRKNDTFVELYKRGKIANENNGKLFISIHCNSVASKSPQANGYEVYLLRPGRTAEAISIAERENGVISYEDNPKRYQKLTDENFILVSMAHASNMKYSEKFADLLDKHLRQNVSITSRGIKQAGFYVLVGASMPGILFETGYVTNEHNAAYIKSKNGQDEIARSMFQAVKSFKMFYARELGDD
ncbi:MAG: N-acetylmuramoyl-L-alanine amidase [Ignavibacteria bacterium]|nr:N-acetylmuramoyl-L-alanine amidase [Ignavibacteria bacterium]